MSTPCAENRRAPSIPRQIVMGGRRNTYPDGGTEKLDVNALIILGAEGRVHNHRVEEPMPERVSRRLL